MPTNNKDGIVPTSGKSLGRPRDLTRGRLWFWLLLAGSMSHAGVLRAQTAATHDRPTVDVLGTRVDRYFAPLVANHDFAGAVLIARGDTVLLDRAYGIADPVLDIPSSPAHRYGVASLTKTFTAAAIVMLAERGSLRLEDPLSHFLPDFPGAGDITILDLLRHEAGLDNPDYSAGFRESIDLNELVRRIGALPPLFAPGTQERYSNAAYNVLARVIEVASGVSYDEFLRRNIFQPLGMIATGNFPDDTIVPGRLRSFTPGPPPAGVVAMPGIGAGFSIGSGSIVSTTGDLYRWARAVHSERLYRRSALAYPYGWGRLGADRRAGINQTGLANGFTSSLAVWFVDSLYVVILSNIESARWTQWSTDVAAIARGDTVSLAPLRHMEPLVPALAARFVGEYATTDRSVVIEQRSGSLWMLLNGWPVPRYLAPVAPGKFELRSDFGHIVFDTVGAGPSARLTWVFGADDRTVYPRRARR